MASNRHDVHGRPRRPRSTADPPTNPSGGSALSPGVTAAPAGAVSRVQDMRLMSGHLTARRTAQVRSTGGHGPHLLHPWRSPCFPSLVRPEGHSVPNKSVWVSLSLRPFLQPLCWCKDTIAVLTMIARFGRVNIAPPDAYRSGGRFIGPGELDVAVDGTAFAVVGTREEMWDASEVWWRSAGSRRCWSSVGAGRRGAR